MKTNVVVLLGIICSVCSVAAMAPTDKSSVKPSHISLPSGAGSIEGLGESFEPQLNTGGATYGVNITLPQGRAGLTPSVRLQYDSNTGNGIGGLGWNMEFMCIKRQTDKGLPEYNSGDTFIFQGEELVSLTDGTWRCENERQFYRFRQIDSDGDDIFDAWEVTEPNGTRHLLGRHRGENGSWSVVEHPDRQDEYSFDRTYCWMVDETIDLHGNQIYYEYIHGNGVLYPSLISYSKLEGAVHEIYFEYEERPDVFDDFRPTFSARLDRRIKRIDVKTNGRLVRGYLFEYEYKDGDLTPDLQIQQNNYLDLGVSLLKRVVQVDNSGDDENYLPPLLFFYTGLDLNQANLRTFIAKPELDLALSNGGVQLVDLDGDGLPDLFSAWRESVNAEPIQRACLNQGEKEIGGKKQMTFSETMKICENSPIDITDSETVIHDVKSKGLVDVSILKQDGLNKVLISYMNGIQLDFVDEGKLGFVNKYPTNSIMKNPPDYVSYNQAQTRVMDVNFDKRGDFIKLVQDGTSSSVFAYFYYMREGDWIEGRSELPGNYPYYDSTFADRNGDRNHHVHLSDMNGDRMTDLVYLRTESTVSDTLVEINYWPLCGLGKFGEKHILNDVDGMRINIGSTDLSDVFVEDFTGDGLADLLFIRGTSGDKSKAVLYVNIAGKYFSGPFIHSGLPRYVPRDSSNPTVLRIADMNASGSLDLLYRNTDPDSWDYVELMPKGKPNLLNCIDNSLGKRTTIVYGTAAEDERIAFDSHHPWKTHTPFALQVVRQIRTSCGLDLNGDGEEDVAVSEFRYRDPYYDGLEREFRGFAFAQRIDYGDDYLFDSSVEDPWFDPITGLMKNMKSSEGWDHGKTPTRQVSGPSLVSRYRFLTGGADQQDNDEYEDATPDRLLIDEYTFKGGREEEVLKGMQVVEEKIDPAVLHSGEGDFDEGCEAAGVVKMEKIDKEREKQRQDKLTPAEYKLTPNEFVYTRVYQDWKIRRLYRPTELQGYLADQNRDGIFEDYREDPTVMIPPGRFEKEGISVVDGDGRSVSFAFVHSLVTEVREANGLLASDLQYPEKAFLQTRKEFDYDDYGNKILEKDYGVEGNTDTYDDERVTKTTYALGGEALKLWVINQPDTIEVTDENEAFVSKKIYFYDGKPFEGVQGEITDRALLHRTVEYVSADKLIQATRSQFDSYGNVIETRDPNNNPVKVEWDDVFKTYPVCETIVVGDGNPDLVMTAEYDYGFGVITHSTDFNGQETDYIYDSFGRAVKTIMPGDTEEYPTTSYEYQLVDIQRNMAFNYDSEGNLSRNPVPVGASSRIVTHQRMVSGEPEEFITAAYMDGCGKELAKVESGEEQDYWVVKNVSSYNLRQTVQAVWQPYQISCKGIPQFSDLKDNMDMSVYSTDNYYDPVRREIRTVLPPETVKGERRERWTRFLPFEEQFFDEEDSYTESEYADTPHIKYKDGLDRLIALEEIVKLTDDGEAGKLTTWRTEYKYDLNDNVTQIKDSQGNIKAMYFDGLKRMVSMDDPDMGKSYVTYDDASNIIETLDAKGQKVVYTYDGANRIKSEDYLDEAGISPDVEYFYDTPQKDLAAETPRNTKGHIAWVKDLAGETHFSYDDRQRIEWELKRIPTSAGTELSDFKTAYTYDSIGNIRTVTYPSGEEFQQEYNTRNLLTRIQGKVFGEIIGKIGYRASGQFDEIEYGNSIHTSYVYDPRLRLTRLKTEEASGKTLMDFAYTFDGVSNILQIKDQRDFSDMPDADKRYNTQLFQYDDLYRVTQAAYPSMDGTKSDSVDYRYDRIGNMLSQVSSIAEQSEGGRVNKGQMTYGGSAGCWNRIGRGEKGEPGPHALSAVSGSGVSYTYDGNGNMLEMDGMKYTWDFRDRLAAVENDSMRAEYAYDYTNRRISKRVWSKDAEGELSEQPESVFYINQYFELRDNEQILYVWNGSTRVASIALHPENQEIKYYHQDHLGSSGVMTDAEGVLVEEFSYYPFGDIRNHYEGDRSGEPYQFTQKERDKESGLNYFEARYQTSGLGRFISVDPLLAYQVNECLEDSQKLNLYAYCQNRPLIYIDPTGNSVENSNSSVPDHVKQLIEYQNRRIKNQEKWIANHKRADSWRNGISIPASLVGLCPDPRVSIPAAAISIVVTQIPDHWFPGVEKVELLSEPPPGYYILKPEYFDKYYLEWKDAIPVEYWTPRMEEESMREALQDLPESWRESIVDSVCHPVEDLFKDYSIEGISPLKPENWPQSQRE